MLMINLNEKKTGLSHCFLCGKEIYSSNFICKNDGCASLVYGKDAYKELTNIFATAVRNNATFIELSEAWYLRHNLSHPKNLVHKRTRKFNLIKE